MVPKKRPATTVGLSNSHLSNPPEFPQRDMGRSRLVLHLKDVGSVTCSGGFGVLFFGCFLAGF